MSTMMLVKTMLMKTLAMKCRWCSATDMSTMMRRLEASLVATDVDAVLC